MKKTRSFDMNWLQDVLEIRPIFSSTEICWSSKLNDKLAKEAEKGHNDWALLVLDSLSDHFVGRWGEASKEEKESNDNSLKAYLSKDPMPGKLISRYSNGNRSLVIITSEDYSSTIVAISNEFDN